MFNETFISWHFCVHAVYLCVCVFAFIFMLHFRGATNEGKRQLVILHPLKVSVYSLHLTEGLAEHGTLTN